METPYNNLKVQSRSLVPFFVRSVESIAYLCVPINLCGNSTSIHNSNLIMGL